MFFSKTQNNIKIDFNCEVIILTLCVGKKQKIFHKEFKKDSVAVTIVIAV